MTEIGRAVLILCSWGQCYIYILISALQYFLLYIALTHYVLLFTKVLLPISLPSTTFSNLVQLLDFFQGMVGLHNHAFFSAALHLSQI